MHLGDSTSPSDLRPTGKGCDGHLVKPVSLPDLQKLLAEAEASR